MTPLDVVAACLAEQAPGRRTLLVDDPAGLLATPESWTDPDGIERLVIEAAGNVSFRARYELVRDCDVRVLVVRRRPDVFMPDVEAAAGGEGWLRLTPRVLLRGLTGDDGWPDWTEREDELLVSRFDAVARAWRVWRAGESGPLTPAAAESILLRAQLGLDLTRPVDPADAWQALFRNERAIRRLRKRGSPLAERLQAWLRHQPAPVGWLSLDDPTAAVRLTWLVAVLQPHVADLAKQLPRLYPGAHGLAGQDATAVARVAYRLERLDPELAAAQRDAGEDILDGPLRAATVGLLELQDASSAVRVLRRETRSGHLVLMALRCILAAAASDAAPEELGLEPDLDHLLGRMERLSHAAAVRAHAELLRALLRLDRAYARLARWAADSEAASVADGWPARLAGAQAATVDRDLATARQALLDNALSETNWDPVPDSARHKGLLTSLFARVQWIEERWLDTERIAARSLLEQWVAGAPPARRAARAWDDVVEPLRHQRGEPRTCVVLVAGLSWADWEQVLASPLGDVYDGGAEPLWGVVPAAAEWSLRRALGGMRWRPEAAAYDWDELFGRLRPELGLHGGRAVPVALAPLAELGLVRFVRTSAALCAVGLDLLAGGSGGVPVDQFEQRLTKLAAALCGLAHSGRRDELVIVLGVSGAVRCLAAPGQALSGQPLGARCLLRPATGEEAAGVVVASAALFDGLGTASQEVYFGTGRGRLAPAAAEATVADGGLATDELLVPLAALVPLPRGERATVEVSGLMVPQWLTADEPAQLALYATLTGGALAEVATLTASELGVEPVRATLDLGERRLLTLSYTPTLPPGERRAERSLEVELLVGRRRLRRRAPVTVVAPAGAESTGGPAAEPAREPGSTTSTIGR